MSRLWEKGLPLDERVLRFTAGEDHALDARLVSYDVRASIAHAEMLATQKLLSDEDCASIRNGLTELELGFKAGDWQITLADEDVHTALETRLTQEIGDAGGHPSTPGSQRVHQNPVPVTIHVDETRAGLDAEKRRVFLDVAPGRLDGEPALRGHQLPAQVLDLRKLDEERLSSVGLQNL